jgi:uncharacterized protein
MSHLRFATLSPEQQLAELKTIIRSEDWLMDTLRKAKTLDIDDDWIVAGAIYNTVWNRLSGRPSLRGIKDIDLFYFDPSDLSYEAEDRVIRRGETVFAGTPLPVEIRNQARVHLWFGRHFGFDIEPIASCRDSIRRFASVSYCVGVRLDDHKNIEVFAPHGLADLFSFRIRPNRFCDNRKTHDTKAARAKSLWPELSVEPW